MLELLASENLRVCNTFSEKKSYHTWKDFGSGNHHMLDALITSKRAFKLIRDCGKIPFGIQSDHNAIMAKLHLNSIAFKHNMSVGNADWKTIKEEGKKRKGIQ